MSDFKIAVVGAGIAGLYATWRLAVDGKHVAPEDIVLIEGSDRTGGRLRSWPLDRFDPGLPADPSVRAELGGMRVLNYNIYVCSLTTKLGLGLVPFPADVPANWHFLRGRTLQTSAYPQQTVYPLAPNEQGWTPGDVVYFPLVEDTGIVPKSAFPTKDGSITQRQFVDTVMRDTKIDGVPAWKLGFWNAILTSGGATMPPGNDVSYQAYAYFLEAGAYDTIPSSWNASVAISNLLGDFANSPSYWALQDGYESLPNALAAEISTAGVKLQSGTPVAGLVQNQDATFSLMLADGTALTADQVVLALPPRALEILARGDAAPSVGTPPLRSLLPQIRQSTPIPLTKVFLVYDQDWWSSALDADWPAFTRMTTDLPMRQIYKFGQVEQGGKTYYLFQAVYCDSLKAGYWAGLMPQEAENKGESVNADIFAHIENLAGTTIDTGTLQFDLSDKLGDFPMFEAAHAQFATLIAAIAAGNQNPDTYAVAPVAGAAMNWGTDPYGGGVNFWNAGVQLDDGAGGGAYWTMMNPSPGLFVAGEGYSLYQGWVEGALWSAEDMLQRYFGMSGPSWLDTTPYTAPAEHVPAIAAKRGAMVADEG